MFRRMLSFVGAMAFIFLIAGAMVVRAQQHQEHHNGQVEVEVGKKGEVSFHDETKVGDLILKPGSYQFQHRAEKGAHYGRFTELGKRGPGDVAGEVKCALVPVSEESSRTAVFSILEAGINRVTRVEVKGENVVHVF